ncbi:uncharacterized protein LACBIDRAFT_315152 [Laccaria bicolor S238N-H82]|uniref:Predicted protein n=1 Tax=Laccaria bicolor (strain S238N-H82 / ATCC MYA-4686) TaxID=486041 RepID=B0DZX9_LACBS|nr:uncharacterized protein LACBIDRAFT_315152 [Laccaria bicolor S238N-H82]EDQ99801.1 predicted protein [Laccaria bicolor S238N-H82]|eukprot:XP_001889493.1 predicted protein [Laccaria bicolor S238N-H82]
MKALTLAHDKLLRGRKLVVTFAHQAPLDQYGNGVASGSKHKKSMMETGRPTTLSMLKTGPATRHEGKTQDKIAMMEAKLRQMESTNPKPTSTEAEIDGLDRASTSTLPYHPSLPLKPPPSLPNPLPKPPRPRIQAPLPALPMLPQQQQARSLSDTFKTSSPSPSSLQHHPPRLAKTTKLAGVKIKPKEKEKLLLS